MAAAKLKQYFELSSTDNNRIIGTCKLCKRTYKDLYGIYSNFRKHLKRQHPLEYQKKFCSRQENDAVTDEINTSPDGTTPNESIDTINKSTRVNLSIAKNLIIKCNLPLSTVENPAFRDFMRDCLPKWEPLSIKKLKNVIIASFKEKVRAAIDEALQNVKDLSLTIDGWSDRRGRGFLGVTCHFIDEEIKPKAYLIDFARIKSPHTSENIQRQTEYVLDSYNIKEKVFRIITDNAANMVKAYRFGLSTEEETENSSDTNVSTIPSSSLKVDVDAENFDPNSFQFLDICEHNGNNYNSGGYSPVRLSCFAHTLQLVVRDGLRNMPQTATILEKCRLLSQCSQKCTKIADVFDELDKHIERPTVTRWNSEFIMIKSILAINREDLEAITDLMDHPVRFTSGDLSMMKEMVDTLEPFYEISVRCQGEKVATVSLVVPSVVHLISHLQSLKESLATCAKLAYQLQSALERRFSGITNRLKLTEVQMDDPFNDPLYFMATVLDPAFKFYWLYDLKLSVSKHNRLIHEIRQLIIDEISKNSMCSLAEEAKETNLDSFISTPMLKLSTAAKQRKLFVYDEYRHMDIGSKNITFSEPSKELDVYLNDHPQSTFSEYWKHSQLRNLRKLVIRLFSVQASSAPVERVFSHAGLIFSSRRTNMNQLLFQDLVFLKVNHVLV